MNTKKKQKTTTYARTPWLAKLLFLALMASFIYGTVTLQKARSREINMNPLYIDDMFMPQAKYAKPLALGFDHLMADLLYLRAIQAFGAQFKIASDNFTSTYDFFNTLTELDPYFKEAYQFGSMVMSQGNNHEAAIKLNAKGHYKKPNEYRLAYLNTYTANWNLDNPQYAKVWLKKSLNAQDAPKWLERWEPWLDTKTGRFDIAAEGRIRNYLNTYNDPAREIELGITLENTKRTIDQWNLSILHQQLQKYLDEFGKLPENLKQLANTPGYLQNYRAANYRRLMAAFQSLPLYGIDKDKKALEIQKFAIHNMSGIPISPYDYPTTTQVEDAYIMRQDIPAQYQKEALEKEVLVSSIKELQPAIKRQLRQLRTLGINKYLQKHNQYPKKLQDIKPFLSDTFPFNIEKDAAGNPWQYDPQSGTIKSTTFPEL